MDAKRIEQLSKELDAVDGDASKLPAESRAVLHQFLWWQFIHAKGEMN